MLLWRIYITVMFTLGLLFVNVFMTLGWLVMLGNEWRIGPFSR